jgi:hypothetical protein
MRVTRGERRISILMSLGSRVYGLVVGRLSMMWEQRYKGTRL